MTSGRISSLNWGCGVAFSSASCLARASAAAACAAVLPPRPCASTKRCCDANKTSAPTPTNTLSVRFIPSSSRLGRVTLIQEICVNGLCVWLFAGPPKKGLSILTCVDVATKYGTVALDLDRRRAADSGVAGRGPEPGRQGPPLGGRPLRNAAADARSDSTWPGRRHGGRAAARRRRSGVLLHVFLVAMVASPAAAARSA